MDADILSDDTFGSWAERRLGYTVANDVDPIQRGNEIRTVIGMRGAFGTLSAIDRGRHIAAPAVESTETWCVACFHMCHGDPARLREQDLCDEFMTALHRSERRPIQPFSKIDKSPKRRHRFCADNSAGYFRLERQCLHYRRLVERLCSWRDRGRRTRL